MMFISGTRCLVGNEIKKRNSGPTTPAANVLGEVIAPTTVVETETPAMAAAQEAATTESPPAREELPYTV
jgi:hypothetical protein